MKLVAENAAKLAEFMLHMTRVIRHRARRGTELSLVFIGARDVFRLVRWNQDGSSVYEELYFEDLLTAPDGEQAASRLLTALLIDDGVERPPSHRGPRK